MRILIGLISILALTSCGGGRVSGAIGKACMDSGRSAANPALCSCVQRAADSTLTGSDQRRAADFFSDPQKAQDTRQEDGSSNEAFWRRYRDFADRAEAICR